MTDGGHVPSEGLPEHLLAGSHPAGRPEGIAVPVAPVPGAADQGIPGFPVQAAPAHAHGATLHGAPPHGAVPPGGEGLLQRPGFTFLDQPDAQDGLDDEDDVLLMPGPQGSWGEPLVHIPAEPSAPVAEAPVGVDTVALRPLGEQHPEPAAEPARSSVGTPVEPSWPPLAPPVMAAPAPQDLAAPALLAAAQAGPALAGAEPAADPAVAAPAAAPLQGQDQLTAVQQPRRPLHAGPPIPDPSLMTGHVPVRSLADRGPSQGSTPAHGVRIVAPVEQPPAAAPVAVRPPVAQAVPVADAPVPETPAVAAPAVEVPAPASEQAPPPEQEAPQAPAEAVVPQPSANVAVEPAQAPAAVAEPAQAQPPVAAQALVEAQPVAEVQPSVEAQPEARPEPVAEVAPAVEPQPQPVAAPAQPRGRISAFLAAPTPHGLPTVEAQPVVEQAAAEVAPQQVAPQEAAPEQPAAERSVPEHAVAAELVTEQPVAEQPVAEQPVVADQAEPAVSQQEQPQRSAQPEDGQPQPAAEATAAVEAVDAVTVADGAEAVTAPPGTAAAPETAAGTGDMPSGRPVDAPATEPQAVDAAPAPEGAADPAQVQLHEQAPAEQPGPSQEQPPAQPEAPVDPQAQYEQQTPEQPRAEAAPEPEEGTAIADRTDPAASVADPAVDPAAAVDPVGADAAAASAAVVEPEPPAPAGPRGPAAEGFDDAGRAAVHQVIRERRDIRNGFRPDPIPHEVLIRVLEAAHTAPSVGYSQPWDFVVIRSAKTRRKMHELAERQRVAYADSLPKGRAKQFKEIKIEAILDTPVNIVVTADRTRGGRHTLGRHTQPQMAPYSAALAVENLWLAARAEGLGVGWVSFFDEDEMVRELGLPEHLEVVAYLCVGYVDSFPEEPELQQQGWAKKRPLSWVVHEEQYGNRALPGEEPHSLLADTLRGIRPLDAKALGEAWDRQKRMTKPAGSLGMLEIISAQLCGLSRKCPPPIPEPGCVAIFAGDHGVHAQGVSPWPQEVTAQMVANFLAGGAVINSFAKQIGTEVVVVDVGVKTELPDAIQSGRTTGLLPRKVKPGTDDMTQGPAMSREEALKAIEVGIETARDLVAAGNKVLITGDMGIGNTTASAALISVFAGLDPAEVTGRGTGIDDAMHAHKIEVIRAALALHQPDPSDPIGVLAAVGGLEHAALAGFMLGAASLRTPVVLDGVIAGSAALAAKAIAPEVLAACIAGHRSAEPGHQAALAKLGLRPLIDLDLRLGEGTGALLALPLVQSAARSMHDVATFDSAGVTEKA
ncbi:nicotinate-nucleotide--dimethylbenzimidazole phosphoribosyltransferase [Kitasatospora sp. NBC_00240]|uniref:nicotinate-nucleotide--dimethylbenzimidazole phosphoribosyltransferase n=1 Tax=Kitasatospora sp. NBC_00240 TaxID=2903567 RepID=UPI002252CFF8|nr:nicotinate-nucleotide--dimethylbenzimidazole phosphoribosyltransferase [Kitasatospora sp. NBC_00240]MCX5209255.1 nicotinate-nucleotide--dimethylbenzimidazole phosphoribosyltransferase [Kitasatospora sp. NBC_00240]